MLHTRRERIMANSTTMGVRFTEEERDWISQYAAFAGKTVSEVIREAVLETVEDAVDLYEYNCALVEDDDEYISNEEMMRLALEAE